MDASDKSSWYVVITLTIQERKDSVSVGELKPGGGTQIFFGGYVLHAQLLIVTQRGITASSFGSQFIESIV